jgi:hypothetical protein
MFARAVALFFFLAPVAEVWAQLANPTPDAVRVTVSMNADGSRTTYQFDGPNHRATATTTTQDGKTVGKIRYVLDEAGRFASGEVYGPDEKLRFKTLYKYDDAGRLTEETQLGADDAVRNKIVYAYDKIGKQIGYRVYDAAGKLLKQTPRLPPLPPRPTRPTPTPTPKRR